MKKVMIVALIVAIHTTGAASSKPSTATTATTHAATTALATNPELTAKQVAQLPVMGKIEWFREHPDGDGHNVSYGNTVIALRGMLNNHPDLKTFAKKGMWLNCTNSCAVAASMVCHAKSNSSLLTLNDNLLGTVVTSLEQTPLTTPAGCDGTTCAQLLDKTKFYLHFICFDCDGLHGPTEYCNCTCGESIACQSVLKGTAIHKNEQCPEYRQPAVLWVDKQIAQDRESRKRAAASVAYEQRQQEERKQFLQHTNEWIGDMEPFMQEIDAKKAPVVDTKKVAVAIVSCKKGHRYKPRKLKPRVIPTQGEQR